MDALIRFYSARLDEVEAAARAASPGPWRWDGDITDDKGVLVSETETVIDYHGLHSEGFLIIGQADATHIALHDPAAVLADIAAKRAILHEHEMNVGTVKLRRESIERMRGNVNDAAIAEDEKDLAEAVACVEVTNGIVALLALPYAAHPDYDESWRP